MQKEFNNEFKSFYTDRLYVRQTISEDLTPLMSLYGDSVVMKKYTDGQIRSLERIRQMIDLNTERWERGNPYSSMSVFIKESNEFIGNVFVSTYDRSEHSGLLGYLFKEKYWGKGYAKEAVSYLINNYLQAVASNFKVKKINEIVAYSRIDNIASTKILTKLNFINQGVTEKYGFKRYLFIKKLD